MPEYQEEIIQQARQVRRAIQNLKKQAKILDIKCKSLRRKGERNKRHLLKALGRMPDLLQFLAENNTNESWPTEEQEQGQEQEQQQQRRLKKALSSVHAQVIHFKIKIIRRLPASLLVRLEISAKKDPQGAMEISRTLFFKIAVTSDRTVEKSKERKLKSSTLATEATRKREEFQPLKEKLPAMRQEVKEEMERVRNLQNSNNQAQAQHATSKRLWDAEKKKRRKRIKKNKRVRFRFPVWRYRGEFKAVRAYHLHMQIIRRTIWIPIVNFITVPWAYCRLRRHRRLAKTAEQGSMQHKMMLEQCARETKALKARESKTNTAIRNVDDLLNSADDTIKTAENASTAFREFVDGFGMLGIELRGLDNELKLMEETWGTTSFINPLILTSFQERIKKLLPLAGASQEQTAFVIASMPTCGESTAGQPRASIEIGDL